MNTRRKGLEEHPDVPSPLIEPGDVVMLRDPYTDPDGRAGPDAAYTHGIVADVAGTYNTRDLYESGGFNRVSEVQQLTDDDGMLPRNVGLFLFNPQSRRMRFDKPGPGDHGVPTFVDYNVRSLILVQKGRESYNTRNIDIARTIGRSPLPPEDE